MKTFNLVLAAVFVLIINPADAALVATWEFDNSNPVVGPTDTVELKATIHNDISSDSRLVCCTQLAGGSIGGVIASSGYSFGSLIFDETFAPSNPYDVLDTLDFDGLDLAPGESFNFIFGLLVPHNGPISDGVYTFLPQITIRTNENPVEGFTIGPNAPLYVTVSSVPIPGSIYLFVGGLAFLMKVNGRGRGKQMGT